MTIGPLEFVVIGCKGDRFTSEIMPELSSIQEKGLIRVVDLIFVRKDTDGTVKALEVVLLEHAWIVRLTEGLNRADAVLLAGGMVPQAAMEQLEAELKAAQQQSQES